MLVLRQMLTHVVHKQQGCGVHPSAASALPRGHPVLSPKLSIGAVCSLEIDS